MKIVSSFAISFMEGRGNLYPIRYRMDATYSGAYTVRLCFT